LAVYVVAAFIAVLVVAMLLPVVLAFLAGLVGLGVGLLIRLAAAALQQSRLSVWIRIASVFLLAIGFHFDLLSS
jgi:hypothetical protein